MEGIKTSMLQSKSKRDRTLDALKGVGIIFVILGHIYHGYGQNIIYLFHMPLFFFASGAVLSYSDNGSIQFLKRAKHLLVPYFVFSLLSFLYWWQVELRFRPSDSGYEIFSGILGSIPSIGQQFINIFLVVGGGNSFKYNPPLWFLPCMFLSLIIYSFIRRYNLFISFLSVAGLASFYWLLRDWNLEKTPLCFGLPLLYVPFLWVGEQSYKYFRQNKHAVNYVVLIATVTLIFITLFICNLTTIKMNGHSYGEWWHFYVISLSLIILILFMCKLLSIKDNIIFTWLGENSLALMCLHGPLYRIVLKMASILTGHDIVVLRDSLIISLCLTAITIIILVPIIVLLNKKFAFVFGRY